MGKHTVKGKKEIWFPQRSYLYESKATGETEEQWMKRVEHEWSLEELQKQCKNIISIQWVFHDNDFLEDGTPKGLHAHAVVELEDKRGIYQERAKAIFGCSCDDNCQAVNDIANSCMYLLHMSPSARAERKTPYSPDIIHVELDKSIEAEYTNSRFGIFGYWVDCTARLKAKADKKEADRKKEAINTYCSAIGVGQLTAHEAIEKVAEDIANVNFTTTDALKNTSLFEAAEARFARLVKHYTDEHTFCKTNIYVSGVGGSGKTTLCHAYAQQHAGNRGVHTISANGIDTTFDFADGYNMQIVSVANEVNGASFGVEQFCDILDGKYATKANSRGKDKFYAPGYVLLNNSVPLESFIRGVCRGVANNKVVQVRRRFAVNVEVIANKGTVRVSYRNNKYNYEDFFDYNNYPVGAEPFITIGEIPYNPNDENTVNEAVKLIDDAVRTYYDINNFEINPFTAGWGVMKLGEVVPLPNEDDFFYIGKEKVVWYNGTQYNPDDFIDWVTEWVDLIDKYDVGTYVTDNAGRVFEMRYTHYKIINDLFYRDKLTRILPDTVKKHFMDVRTRRKNDDKWIAYKRK